MRRNIHVALVSLGLLGTAACDSFLTDSSDDPNRPTDASIRQLFVGVQASQFAFQEGTVAMQLCLWVQTCGAANGRFVQQAYNYVFGEGTDIGSGFGDWILLYNAGGLIDIRQVQADARAAGDSTWLGIAKIWEGLAMGTAAALWGDIPYSQALVNAQPVLDDRFAVYSSLQTLLDQAIAELLSGDGVGPAETDLVFGGDADSWIAAAYTLKARYHMHTAESLGTPAYTAAIAAATNGISDATGASDFASFHTTTTSERNMWAQFQASSGFGNDLSAGKELVDRMRNRRDPRMSSYVCRNVTAAWAATTAYTLGTRILDSNGFAEEVTTPGTSGAAEPSWSTIEGNTTTDGTVTWTNRGLPYGGDDPNAAQLNVSRFSCLPARFAATARIPYVSYVENQLILAESFSTAANPTGGNDATALTHLNNVRAYVNATFPATAPLVPLTPQTLVGITGAALLDSIMTEKYISMFQNIESYSDYRRTCIPNITPADNNRGFTNVPGRFYYPLQERNTNPNIPDPSVQNATHGFRNRGDITGCNGPAR
jgi:starch-binding outer membrane protein, SusD/RagB family